MTPLARTDPAARRPHPPVVRRPEARARLSRGRAGLVVAAYPRMGSSIAVALGIVAAHGLGLTPVALLAAGLVFAVVAACHAEGTAMFPELGGSAAFARHAFNELAGFITGWALGLALIALTAVAALFVPHYLSVFWSPLGRSPGDAAGAIVVIALAAAFSLGGLPRSAAAGLLLGSIDLFIQAVLVVLGTAFAFHPHLITRNLNVGTAPSWHGLLLACALAMLAFTGVEAVTDMADEARDPDHDLAHAVPAGVATATGLAVALALVALMAGPVSRSAPLLGIASGLSLAVLSNGLRYLVGLAVAGVLAVTAQAALAALARLGRWLARHNQLPALVGVTNGRSEAAPVAVAAGAIAAAALVLIAAATGGAGLLAGTYVYGILIAYTGGMAAIVAMRLTDPHRYRAFRVPLGVPVDGARVPLPALIAIAGALVGWLAVVVYAPGPRALGSAWMLAGLAGYAAYRRRRGLGLAELSQPRVTPQPGALSPRIAVEFRTILIPANTDMPDIPADAVEVAARLAAERRASVVLLAFTVIPLGEELDMELDDLDETVDRLAARARAIGESYGIRVHTTHLRTRDPAESILTEAARRNSQMILLGAAGLQRRRFRRFTHDGAVRRIVAEAEQRVMIIQPAGAPT